MLGIMTTQKECVEQLYLNKYEKHTTCSASAYHSGVPPPHMTRRALASACAILRSSPHLALPDTCQSRLGWDETLDGCETGVMAASRGDELGVYGVQAR